MKIPKTLFFMVLNPIPLIVHLTWWFFFAALGVVFDDPFIEGTWPRIAQIVSPPSSLGNFVTAASIIFHAITDDIWRNGFWILVVMPPFLICYREARGHLKGTAKEHQVWAEWYRRYQETLTTGGTLAASPPLPKNLQAKSYFRKAQKTILSLVRNPKLLIIHFLCWIFIYFFLILMTELPDIADAVRTAGSFFRNFSSAVSYLAIIAAIFALISSYQEARGNVKGITKVQQAWTEWYHKQQQGTPFDVSPPLFDTTL